MKIALAGNPNSGKTTLFNGITGKTEYVGNWPGVTVEKKEANLRRRYRKIIDVSKVVDLPGAYSIAPFTSEEAIARDFILDESPDVIINIVDSSSLERSLFFTTQLMELGIPMLIALNKQDIIKKHGDSIDIEGLSKSLKCEIIETTASEGDGLTKLIEAVKEIVEANKKQEPLEFEGKGTEREDKQRQFLMKLLVAKYVIHKIDKNLLTLNDKVDRILAHPYFGLPIFGLIMWLVYSLSINGIGGYFSGYLNDTIFGELIPNTANTFFENIGVHPLLQALIVDGIIAGVGAVIGFIPLIMVLFFCLALLEDSGYMARVAVIMDRYFKRIGLSGKSIIPMIVGTGCSIPGVMATRTIENENEKRVTIMLAPFVPCGAKLPIIALFAAVFFPGKAWVGPSMYLIAIALIALGGILLNKIFGRESDSAFIMELPEYKLPNLRHAVKQMLNQAKLFVIKASTIILVMNTIVWFMQTYGWNLQIVSDQSNSILATFGGVVAPILIPLGFLGWQLSAASLTGFIAKENVVATFAILLAVTSEDALLLPGGPLSQFFTPVTAYAFLAFNLFTPPCFAAIGAMRLELGNNKWLGRAVLFQLTVGYTLAMLITQIGTLVIYGEFAPGYIPAVIILVVIIVVITLMIKRENGKKSDMEVATE